jgi:RNA polymerase sigma-70 factor (ECF subfamily)
MIIQKESENALVEKLKNNSKSAFSVIFLTYYQDLVRFAFRFTKNLDLSEEIVQDVFIKIWEERSTLEFHHSLKSFLLKSVQNLSIDRLRHLNIVNKYASLVLDNPILSENATENYVLRDELELNYIRAMEKIPIEYADVYRMSRVDALNYQEIAQKLGVSVRTVEVRIGKALCLLRKELKDFLITIILFFQLLN